MADQAGGLHGRDGQPKLRPDDDTWLALGDFEAESQPPRVWARTDAQSDILQAEWYWVRDYGVERTSPRAHRRRQERGFDLQHRG